MVVRRCVGRTIGDRGEGFRAGGFPLSGNWRGQLGIILSLCTCTHHVRTTYHLHWYCCRSALNSVLRSCFRSGRTLVCCAAPCAAQVHGPQRPGGVGVPQPAGPQPHRAAVRAQLPLGGPGVAQAGVAVPAVPAGPVGLLHHRRQVGGDGGWGGLGGDRCPCRARPHTPAQGVPLSSASPGQLSLWGALGSHYGHPSATSAASVNR